MRILVCGDLPGGCDPGPTLDRWPAGSALGAALDLARVDAVVALAGEIAPACVAAWRAARPTAALVLVAPPEPTLLRVCAASAIELVAPAPGAGEPGPRALGQAEALVARARARAAERLARARGGPGRVLLVGAGIVNLVTAVALRRAGLAVELCDAGPDPRLGVGAAIGATYVGAGARIFSRTEAVASLPGRAVARQAVPVTDGGLLLVPPARLGSAERAWLAARAGLPAWRAELLGAELTALGVRAGAGWRELMAAEPELFADVDLRHGVVGPDGELEAEGFSLDVHRLAGNLLAWLERRDVATRWAEPVRLAAGVGRVDAVHGRAPLRCDHVVLSPGAHGGDLLAGTASADRIQAVLGVWLSWPGPGPARSGRRRVASGPIDEINVIGTRAGLHLSGGHGFAGRDPTAATAAALEPLFAALAAAARVEFPREVAGGLGVRRACARPVTASGMGLLEVLPFAGRGLALVSGGHGTGGFALAPELAAEVAAALRGQPGDAIWQLHPTRTD